MCESETSEYIFFIFDENVMKQSEYDDIEEAVLFYQPKTSFLENDERHIYLLFGHIVGIVKCTETLTDSLPCIIRLEKTKFAIVRNTHYLLFLGYNTTTNNVPDLFIKKQLKKFLDVFAFYHGSFERLTTSQNNVKEEELMIDLELICSNYLAFAQGYDLPIHSIFDPLPTISFDRTSSSIFAKVCHILQTCQRIENIYCGCLFAESRVISSQISPSLVRHLLLLKANQKSKHVSTIKPGFDLPFGVRILRVFVTEEQYSEIVNSCLNNQGTKEKNKYFINNNSSKEDENVSKTNSDSSLISSKDDSENSVGAKSLTNMPSLEAELLQSSYGKENILEAQMGHLHVEEPSSFRILGDKVKEAVFDNDSSPKRYTDEKSSDEYFLLENDEKVDKNCISKEEVSVDNSKMESVETDNPVSYGMHELHLYVQAHSSIALFLFMEFQETYEYQTLRLLWEMLLPHLGDLEAQVKSLLSSKKDEDIKSSENVSYINYDKVADKCQTNLSDVINSDDRAFINSINTFHHQLESSSLASDITFIKSNLTNGYAHKSSIEEVYLQQRGNYKPSLGSPINTESLWRLDQQSGSKLRKLTKSNFLL